MNVEQAILAKRLLESGVDSRRFLKLDTEKAAFETGWQNRLYTPEELQGYPYWGICGRDGLVLVDADTVQMDQRVRQILPPTFEVRSPRRGLPHFYIVVEGGQVPNKTLHLNCEEEGQGEIRAQNEYLVAPGTEIKYRDLKTSEPKVGIYTIIQNRPFARMKYYEFMSLFEPYFGSNPKQRITHEQMRMGVPKGTRHAQGIKFACYLVGVQRFDCATALHAMEEWNKLCQPPMPVDDLERMVKNAIDYIAAAKEKRKLSNRRNFLMKVEQF
jgi:hypothetical protein